MPTSQIDYISVADVIVTAIVTVAAAFVGARYAFKLQNRKERALSETRHVESVDLAQFTLIRQHNFYLNVKAQLLGEFEEHPNRHHFIKPLTAISIEPPQFDFASLSFLFKKDANVLFELAVLQQDLAGTLQIIRERSDLHATYLQPAVEKIQASSNSEYVSVDLVERELGMRRTMELKQATDYVVEGINRAIADTRSMSDKLRAAAKRVYPQVALVGFKVTESTPGET